MSVYSPFQSASASGQGTYGQSQSYGPFSVGQQAHPQDIWQDLGLGSPQQAVQTVQQVGQAIQTISGLLGMLNASPTGQQPVQYGQQQASPQDIWGTLGSVLSSPQVLQSLSGILGMLNASPTGQQQPGMPGQYGQQQARPQDIWGSLGSAFGQAGQAISSAAPDILGVAKQVAPVLPVLLALASASPTGQQSGAPGPYSQYGQQQANPQDIWGALGSAFGSPQQAAQTVQQVGQAIQTVSGFLGMLNASPTGQQPGMSGQYGRQY